MKNLSPTLQQSIPLLLCFLLTAFFVYFPITDSDIFWHLAAGREMVAHKKFLSTDPFAYTLLSPAWIDLHWLFQIICYGLYTIGAERALLLFKFACVGCTAALLCLTHRNVRYTLFCAMLIPLLFYRVRYLVDVRPVLVTMLLIAAYVLLFERALLTGKKRLLWWCIPLQILWTNCQGLSMIGLFIIGAYWTESAVRFFRHKANKPLLETAVFLSCVASCLINPYGVSGLLLPFKLLSRITPGIKNIYSLNIAENVPLFSLSRFEAGYRTAVIITAVITLGLFILNKKKLRLVHVVLFIGFFCLSCAAVRNVTLYGIIVVPIISYYAASEDLWKGFNALRPNVRRLSSITACISALFMLLIPVYRHAVIVALYPPYRLLSPFRFPEKITGYLKHSPIPGNMFNDIRYGGYLIWHLYPEKKVFIDTRLVIRPPEFFAEYLALSYYPELFAHVAEKFNITHVILPSALFSCHVKLIKWLYDSGNWRLESTDGASVLFVRSDVARAPGLDLSDTAAAKIIADSIGAQWKDSPAVRSEALDHFADLLEKLDFHNVAQTITKRR
jgi:hypothetical protein